MVVKRTPRRSRNAVTMHEVAKHVGVSPMTVSRVISGDEEARRTFVDDLLGPLRAQRAGGALVAAVLELARSGFRMRETAMALGIHPNTLRYRLARAGEILKIRSDDPEARFQLQLVARLLDIDDSES